MAFRDLLNRLRDRLTGPTGLPDGPPAPTPPGGDPAAPPAPAPRRRGVVGWLTKIAGIIALAGWTIQVLLWVFGDGPRPGPMPPLPMGPEAQLVGDDADRFLPATGWVPDPAAVEQSVREQRTPAFGDTPAGKAALGDGEWLLWRAVRQAAGRQPTDDWYPNENQRDVGCCVGAGTKHGVDVVLAAQSLAHGEQWKPVSIEAIYALSRVEVGGGKIRGDGSVGAWAADAIQRWGVLPMEAVGEHDLSKFDPYRARAWGKSGLPNDLEAVAREHPVKGAARVNSWADVKRAVGQHYPVVVCSDQGFRMQRDADGFCRPSGSWMHCMVVLGVRTQPREGGFILNSWGDTAHTGPRYPADAPQAGFWADAATIDRMVKQGDSYALSDAVGFPARRLPWFVNAEPAPAPAPGRRADADRPLLALAH